MTGLLLPFFTVIFYKKELQCWQIETYMIITVPDNVLQSHGEIIVIQTVQFTAEYSLQNFLDLTFPNDQVLRSRFTVKFSASC